MARLLKKASSASADSDLQSTDTISTEQGNRELSPAEKEEIERRADEKDWVLVDEELDKYCKSEGKELNEDFDIIKYWEVSNTHFKHYFTLTRMSTAK